MNIVIGHTVHVTNIVERRERGKKRGGREREGERVGRRESGGRERGGREREKGEVGERINTHAEKE